jgi:hypothetical protein
MNFRMKPESEELGEKLGYWAQRGTQLGVAGYGLYDSATGESNAINSGEFPMNVAIGLTPVFGAATGYAMGNYLTPPQPDAAGSDNRRSRRAQYGAAIGALATAPFAVNAMRDQGESPSITTNVPMKEMQELSALLGANGAY